jgi:deoxyribodipyrimidine photo-lyase
VTTRALALEALHGFLPRVPRFAHEWYFDRAGHQEVSRLSPWIRHRVISEEECVQAVLSAHPMSVAEKFVQELMWRTYWKGWLELRPGVWSAYLTSLETLKAEYAGRAEYLSASCGKTGLSFFDDWVSELVTTGYLHNHTRMWFASVWIFTLRLPWQLGAEFMYRHLLDGDPASNTLSWRWVGGLQTKGKMYVARPDNIAKYSEGRWCPKESELNLNPDPLTDESVVEIQPLKPLARAESTAVRHLLLHDDDLSADLCLNGGRGGFRSCVLKIEKSERHEIVHSFLSQARSDALRRTGGEFVSTAHDIAEWMRGEGETVAHAMLPRCGDELPILKSLRDELRQHGITIEFLRREWDERYSPFAKSGYFPFWSAAKKLLLR